MAFYTKLTNIGLAKIASAIALGEQIEIIEMALGDGNGAITTPTPAQTALVNEVYRGDLNQLIVSETNEFHVVAELIVPTTEGGWTIREVGLYDADGDLIAVGNFPETEKPEPADGTLRDMIVRTIIEVSNSSVITLIIDPYSVTATHAWVSSLYLLRSRVAGGTAGQILAKGSNSDEVFVWVDPTAAVNVTVDVINENVTLTGSQTIVNFSTIIAQGIAVYIEGVRLILGVDYTVTGAAQITLTVTYPNGSILHAYQNDALDNITGATEESRGIVEFATTAETITGASSSLAVHTAGLKAAIADRIKYFDALTNLRASTGIPLGGEVTVKSHTSGNRGGGVFVAVADASSADNNGTIIVTSGGQRFYRKSEGYLTPEMFGYIPSSNAVDATRAINKCYAFGANYGLTVRFESATYPLDGNVDGTVDGATIVGQGRGGIQIKSNTKTIFSGQVFTQAASPYTAYSLINCSGASDFTIEGQARFIGDALIHGATGGEFGHGLYVCNAHNFKISGLTIETCWGDGLYVSDTDFANLTLGKATMASNGEISDCIFDANRRQGGSGINGTDIILTRCQFINTGTLVFTAPGAGFDLETDASLFRNGMQNWRFNDCVFSGNVGPNVLVFPTLNNGKAGCEDISFNNCIMKDTQAQGSFWSDRSSAFVKNITINGGIIEGGVYGCNATTFNDVKISRSMADVSTAVYAVQFTTGTFGAKFNNCEIRAKGDTTINSKKLVFVDTGTPEANKPVWSNCKFVLEDCYGGATNIVMVTRSPCLFTENCQFLTEGVTPASYCGFDSTAGSSRIGPSYAMLDDCWFDSGWHIGVPTLQGRVSLPPAVRRKTAAAATNNLIATAIADEFEFTYASGGSSTMTAPTDPYPRDITICQKNTGAVALGGTTWNAVYKMAAWVNPAPGFHRCITFRYDGTNWRELTRSTSDIPN
jgi:phage-related tail fiber protein